MEIKIKKLYKDALLPVRGSEQSAGHDLYAYLGGYENCEIAPHTTLMIGTGLSMEIPNGYFGAIFARSGLATKQGLRPANCVGVIDSDYRGEIKIALHNDTNVAKTIQANERVAQIVVLPYLNIEFKEVSDLTDTERGSGGFGSTGKGRQI